MFDNFQMTICWAHIAVWFETSPLWNTDPEVLDLDGHSDSKSAAGTLICTKGVEGVWHWMGEGAVHRCDGFKLCTLVCIYIYIHIFVVFPALEKASLNLESLTWNQSKPPTFQPSKIWRQPIWLASLKTVWIPTVAGAGLKVLAVTEPSTNWGHCSFLLGLLDLLRMLQDSKRRNGFSERFPFWECAATMILYYYR